MSCSCDRSLENGMKSTMLRRALDLLEPAAGDGYVRNTNASALNYYFAKTTNLPKLK